MASPSEKLAQSLEVLKQIQNSKSNTIKARYLTRTHRERLLKHGFIKEVIKGWYISSRPDEVPGDSTSWYTSFWNFCSDYLNDRFGDDWCLYPDQSLLLHSGNWTVPSQLLIKSPKGQNNQTSLLYATSIFDTKLALPNQNSLTEVDRLKLYTVSSGLIACSESFFRQHPIDSRTALSLIKDSSDILTLLLDGGHTTIAGRLAGAFRNIGYDRIANDIVKTMKSADYNIRETDPFEHKLPNSINIRESSPYIQRIRLLWQQMREPIIQIFPKAPGKPINSKDYLKSVDEIYTADAYHSLSIEGYQVTTELIESVRAGNWNPDKKSRDQEQKNALAARGYWHAFQEVKGSIKKILDDQNPGQIVDIDHGDWYRALFQPSVAVGIIKPSDLAGYRNDAVYIKNSKHVPLNRDAVRDCMPLLFELLTNETEPSVRAILGHFIFTFIHPYMDGNGRIGRFLMNTMLASGGYPWTIIPVEKRNEYMSALEKASVNQDIQPFASFVSQEIIRSSI
ncbi:MAG: Fic family protein [Reichenbachiella sp.]|uniref:Fic family protein n=1 Tax=Reichenbachiella sp. TaxID=2184521 RepID=UPI003264769C